MPWAFMTIFGFAMSATGAFLTFVASSNRQPDQFISTTLRVWKPIRWLGVALGVLGTVGWLATALT